MRYKTLVPYIFAFVVAALATTFKSAGATTVAPMTLEQLVSQASFVGIVECEIAGGIVAEYRVVESWKGAPVGTRFRLKTPVDFWEPQFPIALVGQRSVITAFADEAPSRVLSTSGGGGVPLWWRNIPYEYSLPLFQGKAVIPATPGKSFYAFFKDFSSLAQLRARVKEILSLSSTQAEVAQMRSLFDLYLIGDEPKTETPDVKTLKKRITAAKSPAQLANALLALGREDRDAMIVPPLMQGGAETLKFLLTLKEKQWPFDQWQRDQIINAIQSRVDSQNPQKNEIKSRPTAYQQETSGKQASSSDEKTLEEMRRLLYVREDADNSRYVDFSRALETLTKHDPAFAAQFLISWKNPDKSRLGPHQGYILGSYFAWQCSGARAVHLRALLRAQNPYIRVAGAVYLCFENRVEGMAQLQELAKLPDDSGVWAALNLARRGDKTALPRALRVLETPGEGNMDGVPHRNLQKRVLVLLSNSAKQTNLPQPPEFSGYLDEGGDDAIAKKNYQIFTEWWEKNQERITLDDPWLPLLEKQKVD